MEEVGEATWAVEGAISAVATWGAVHPVDTSAALIWAASAVHNTLAALSTSSEPSI